MAPPMLTTNDPGTTTTPATSSRTYLYRRVMKPLLERKRRARINKCLDELKALILEVIDIDAESLAKLEKADILELTVHHLHRQRTTTRANGTNSGVTDTIDRYWCGFQQCAVEVSRFLQKYDKRLNAKFFYLMQQCLPPPPPMRRSCNTRYRTHQSQSVDTPMTKHYSPPVWRPW